MPLELEVTAARYVLGVATGPDLVRAAEISLLAGLESVSLACLAGETDPILSDAGPLFESAMRELSIEIPDKNKACWDLIGHHMTRIAEKKVKPSEGVQTIMDEVYYAAGLDEQAREHGGDSHDLDQILDDFCSIGDVLEHPYGVCCEGKCGPEAAEGYLLRDAEEWLRKHGS